MSAGLLGLALIVRDEEQTLPALLESIEGAFDQVVLVDTGSTDDTVGTFQRWAHKQPNMMFKVGRFEWVDDFAAARNYADRLLDTDWKSWADADDVIVNAGALRELAKNAPDGVAGLIFGYDYAQHPETGECVCHLRRERLVRAGASEWLGRVHEAQVLRGPAQHVPDNVAHWRHVKQRQGEGAAAGSNDRNLRILTAWNDAEPNNSRVVGYLGTEYMVRGDHEQAIAYFREYLRLKTTWDQERAQIHRKLSQCLMALDDVAAAEQSALEALLLLPSWPDSYLTLAECALTRGDADKAIEWARQTLERGRPDTLLIINPLDYAYQPRRIMAAALGAAGRFDEAARVAEEAMRTHGGDHELQGAWAAWKSASKREHTAQTYVMAAQQLIAHDEQAKARVLLEQCVPHFAQDHPDVVTIRSQLRERLLWVDDPAAFAEHYAVGGSKPEDFHSDEVCEQICEALPRVHFLIGDLLDRGCELAEAA